MSEILLQTKLFRPRIQASFVPRPRLIKALNKGVSGKLTLVSAPAGFGKTTLVSSWLQETNQTAAFPTNDLVYQAKADNIRAWHAIAAEDTAGGMAIANDALAQVTDAYPAEQGELLTTISQAHFAQGDFAAGVQTLESALVYLERGEHWAGLSGATAFLMRQYLQRGRLQQARRIGQRFIDQFGSQPMMQIGGGLQASAFYALTLYESGATAEMEQAETLAARALELAELSMPNAEMGIWMRLFLALVKQMRQDEAAHAFAEEAADKLRLLPPHPALVDHYDLQIRYELPAGHNGRA